jgi:7-keto-8-aminopelargonate synthetase-like enzyme
MKNAAAPLPPPLTPVSRTEVSTGGRTLIFFGGCDYYRLSSHPQVLAAARETLRKGALGVSASRCTTGNHPLLETLEQKLAQFFRAPAALVVANGYATNLIVAQTLAGRFPHALLDQRAHGCLADAALLLKSTVHRFPHRDVAAVERLSRRLKSSGPLLLLTDGLCAHDGQVAPLKRYLDVLPPGSKLLVDDAHGGGVVGKNGRGSLEVSGIARTHVIQTITLSKAFGAHGGAILCDRELRREIITGSRMFIGSTPPALSIAAAAMKAIELLAAHPEWRQRATANAEAVRETLRDVGYPIESAPAPIVPVIAGSEREADRLSALLLEAGILPPRLRYPGSPAGGYFRFILSSAHAPTQMKILTGALRKWLARKKN